MENAITSQPTNSTDEPSNQNEMTANVAAMENKPEQIHVEYVPGKLGHLVGVRTQCMKKYEMPNLFFPIVDGHTKPANHDFTLDIATVTQILKTFVEEFISSPEILHCGEIPAHGEVIILDHKAPTETCWFVTPFNMVKESEEVLPIHEQFELVVHSVTREALATFPEGTRICAYE